MIEPWTNFDLSNNENQVIKSGDSGHVCIMMNIAEQTVVHFVTDFQFTSNYVTQV